jgi:hypothetical protein
MFSQLKVERYHMLLDSHNMEIAANMIESSCLVKKPWSLFKKHQIVWAATLYLFPNN